MWPRNLYLWLKFDIRRSVAVINVRSRPFKDVDLGLYVFAFINLRHENYYLTYYTI